MLAALDAKTSTWHAGSAASSLPRSGRISPPAFSGPLGVEHASQHGGIATINGAHVIVYTSDPDGLRAWFRDVLEFPSVDAGDGWLIFALPASEVAVHPTDGSGHHELFLMCTDVHATVAELTRKGVEFSSPIGDRGWGLMTTIRIPGGGEIGLYQPKHASPAHPVARSES